MPKGYLHAEFEVHDAAGFEKYREKVGAVSASFGGRYVVRRAEPVVMGFLLGLALLYIRLTSGILGFDRDDEAAFIFVGSQKSLVSGVPIANALIPGTAIGPILVPIMLYHASQLLVCAWIARRYAAGDRLLMSGVSPGRSANFVEPASVIGHRELRSDNIAVLASVIAPPGKP